MFKETILRMLAKLPADRKIQDRGSSAWIVCPDKHHSNGNEKTPSFRISLDGQFAGSHFCFGCGIKGSWKRTCEVLGFSGPDRFLGEEFAYSTMSEDEEASLLGKERKSENGFREPWPRNQNWRKIPGSLIQDVGGSLLVGNSNKEPLLRLPVNVYGEEKGWIDCKINPRKDEQIKYENKSGAWAKDVLFPYDYVAKMDNDILIMVEGPRDSLVTIKNGFPALATLGSTSWNYKCVNLVMALAPKFVVLLLDPDDAGEKLRKLITKDLKDKLDVVPIRLKHEFVMRQSKRVMKKIEDPADLSEVRLRKILTKAGVL